MRLRAPTVDDASSVLEVLVARDIADIGVPDYTVEDLLDEWRASELDLAVDSRVVELDSRIVAYAMVRGPGTLVAVAPEYEGRGIGARLLHWAEGRERELGRSEHRQWIGYGNERGKALLRAAGYELARSYWRMGLRLEDLCDHPDTAPSGLRLRSLEVDRDAVALHALDAASFAGAPDYHPESLQAYREEHLNAHDLDPELSRVAELGGLIVGSVLARRWTEAPVGFVDILAVHPDHQRKGIGTKLLVEAFRRFRAAGLEDAQLGVASTNPQALRIYERLGMTPRFRYDTYARPVGQTAQSEPPRG
ncbi:MAG: GNAT family N-acetyltransferase [Solirubrobacterales bacterium]|nr:GNAT family N-acetyltransferase [Solirubrobacterales bacterium]